MRDWGAHILHSGRRVCCVRVSCLCRFRVVGPLLLLTAARLVYSGSFAGGAGGGREAFRLRLTLPRLLEDPAPINGLCLTYSIAPGLCRHASIHAIAAPVLGGPEACTQWQLSSV